MNIYFELNKVVYTDPVIRIQPVRDGVDVVVSGSDHEQCNVRVAWNTLGDTELLARKFSNIRVGTFATIVTALGKLRINQGLLEQLNDGL